MAPTSDNASQKQVQSRRIKQRPRTTKPWTPTVLKFGSPLLPLPPPPPSIILPSLQSPINPSKATTIDVENHPERRGTSWTWIVRTRPACQISRGLPIILTSGNLRSGVGRIRGVAEFRRHWITWSIDGSPDDCDVRVPTSWSSLDDRDRNIHTRLYRILSPSPLPHPLLINDSVLLESQETPYEFESDTSDDEDGS
ncbi:uncharacterized protein B0H18DRAFT_964578 [Fomitopsis serialis]|uniref:uncharacterized protein n=1 Tax=Fomitopsis serialis TaxID=139415 RepID=UPI002008A646|nr:uncharacterized protein B0H18DRAFT_964578 [Neoantrodia serialis]KAH9907117.1 hypothetical protein B0H18DRAFT_964578 [Neoantrodia serialis]